MMGDPDPEKHALAHRALVALLTAVGLVLAAYALSYRRHRALLVEGVSAPRKDRRWYGGIFDWLVPDPHQQAVVVFLAKGFAGSGQHRMILMGYGGFGVAVLLSGMMGMPGLVEPARIMAARFVCAHVILLTFLLIGVRHLFSIALELKANWLFRIAEGEGRRQWLRAVDRFGLLFGAAAMLVIPFPLEAWLLGWRALSESVLFAAFGLLCYEALFSSWEKLPFTCSYLPGSRSAAGGECDSAGQFVKLGPVCGRTAGAAGSVGACPRDAERKLGRIAAALPRGSRSGNPWIESSQAKRLVFRLFGESPDFARPRSTGRGIARQ
jgi:hypothetical protein